MNDLNEKIEESEYTSLHNITLNRRNKNQQLKTLIKKSTK
jgi:hypothetical protein